MGNTPRLFVLTALGSLPGFTSTSISMSPITSGGSTMISAFGRAGVGPTPGLGTRAATVLGWPPTVVLRTVTWLMTGGVSVTKTSSVLDQKFSIVEPANTSSAPRATCVHPAPVCVAAQPRSATKLRQVEVEQGCTEERRREGFKWR